MKARLLVPDLGNHPPQTVGPRAPMVSDQLRAFDQLYRNAKAFQRYHQRRITALTTNRTREDVQ